MTNSVSLLETLHLLFIDMSHLFCNQDDPGVESLLFSVGPEVHLALRATQL